MMGLQGNSRVRFDVESAQDIDRKIQNEMYEQPSLSKWGVFYCEQDKRTAVEFLETMQKCF
jgi:hypothetical protein